MTVTLLLFTTSAPKYKTFLYFGTEVVISKQHFHTFFKGVLISQWQPSDSWFSLPNFPYSLGSNIMLSNSKTRQTKYPTIDHTNVLSKGLGYPRKRLNCVRFNSSTFIIHYNFTHKYQQLGNYAQSQKFEYKQ
jgi:hypothetical protein